jgi:hypothetical protein
MHFAGNGDYILRAMLIELKGVNKTYEIKVGKKTKRFFSKNSFLKAVPKQQRPDMESYLMKNEVDFENVQQVLELYRHLTEILNKK